MISRRDFLSGLALAAGLPRLGWAENSQAISTRLIPSTKEPIPVIGMGTWLTFDVGEDRFVRNARAEVLRQFFDAGGTLIDSSPMYGSAEAVVGYGLDALQKQQDVFAATKVWTLGQRAGVAQMKESGKLWRRPQFDLMQIHNMLDWQKHLETLRNWKAEGLIRYIGITTSHGRRHDKLAKALETGEFDFVQFTYNLLDREAEEVLLPLAQEHNIAVIINRPFQGGRLFRSVRNTPLPGYAAEIDCANWAQFFLKFIISHPAVTCAIPATTQVAHMQENMGAAYGALPDSTQRDAMLKSFLALS